MSYRLMASGALLVSLVWFFAGHNHCSAQFSESEIEAYSELPLLPLSELQSDAWDDESLAALLEERSSGLSPFRLVANGGGGSAGGGAESAGKQSQ